MKAFAIAILLFLLVIATVTVNSFYVRRVCDDMAKIAQKLPESDDRGELVESLEGIWTKNRDIFDFTVNTNEINMMNEYVSGLLYAEDALDVKRYSTLIYEMCEEFSNHEGLTLRSLC